LNEVRNNAKVAALFSPETILQFSCLVGNQINLPKKVSCDFQNLN
jgi:hypothetical protein